jgi:hypothetical protein
MSSTQSILTISQHCSADDVDTRSTVARVGGMSPPPWGKGLDLVLVEHHSASLGGCVVHRPVSSTPSKAFNTIVEDRMPCSARRPTLLVQPSIRRWHRLAADGTRVLPACDEAVERGAERRAERVVLSARAAPEAAERLGKLAYLMSEVIREVIKEISRASRQACVPDERGHQGEQGEAIRGAIREVIREVIKESKERQSEQSRPVRSNQKQSEAIRGNQRHSEALRGTQRQS